jgi:hypothetical protein
MVSGSFTAVALVHGALPALAQVTHSDLRRFFSGQSNGLDGVVNGIAGEKVRVVEKWPLLIFV